MNRRSGSASRKPACSISRMRNSPPIPVRRDTCAIRTNGRTAGRRSCAIRTRWNWSGKEASLVNVLFSTIPDDLGLYGKPMARNVQIWTMRPEVLLDGPHASPADIKRAMRTIQAGGVFGYRFLFPAMRVGKHEVYWHRPLVAYRDATGEVAVLPDAPLGYLTAYRRRQAASGSPHRIMAADATATGVTGSLGRPGLYSQTSGAAASSQCPQADSRVRALRGQATARQLRPPNHGTRPRRRRRALAGTFARAGGDPYPRDCRASACRCAVGKTWPSPGFVDVRAFSTAIV